MRNTISQVESWVENLIAGMEWEEDIKHHLMDTFCVCGLPAFLCGNPTFDILKWEPILCSFGSKPQVVFAFKEVLANAALGPGHSFFGSSLGVQVRVSSFPSQTEAGDPQTHYSRSSFVWGYFDVLKMEYKMFTQIFQSIIYSPAKYFW